MKNETPYKTGRSILLLLPILVIILAVLYLLVRTTLFLMLDYHWYEKIVAFFLLFAETFIIIHGIGYFIEIYHVIIHGKGLFQPDDSPPPLESYPPVAIIVSSFNEPLGVVEDTLVAFYNLTYPNKTIYFLDDTRYDLPGQDPAERKRYRQSIDEMCQRIGVHLFRRQWRGAKAGMINDFLDYTEGKEKAGFEYHNYSGTENREKEKYIVVFDADQNPLPAFVEPLIARMEAEPKLAFIQTPQYYTNFDSNRIARASGLQQAVFYEYICEGKSLTDAMFCCGTNVIFRREALMDVGGFDEASVTEDFATSLKFHLKGWRSAYLSKVLAFGMGPEDLGGYFKQQFRWALGTVGLFRQILGFFLRHPRQLVFVKWWEYFLSSTHYFIGLVFLILALCPLLYMFFNVPSYFARPEIYALFFVPYFVFTLTLFFWTLKQRKYGFKDLILGQLLMSITFPVYIKASILGLMGVKGTFGITPKGGAMQLPLKALWPQLSLAVLNFSAVVWGVNRLVYEREPMVALMVNMCWCFYHFLVLSFVLYFNKPEESGYHDT
ncbi:MAG: glycosyltransferase [Deltaproteobacteria bacterium]|nr:glycosyltransferase [Deltaproteobacteria bacterium]